MENGYAGINELNIASYSSVTGYSYIVVICIVAIIIFSEGSMSHINGFRPSFLEITAANRKVRHTNAHEHTASDYICTSFHRSCCER